MRTAMMMMRRRGFTGTACDALMPAQELRHFVLAARQRPTLAARARACEEERQ